MIGKTLALSLLLMSPALAGCGKTGELERPAAMGQASTRHTNAASGQQRDDNGDPNAGSEGAVNRQSESNRNVDPAPSRALPIDGAPQDPGKVQPQGVLPDPYANPQ